MSIGPLAAPGTRRAQALQSGLRCEGRSTAAGKSLTPAELAGVLHASAGLTNPEIGVLAAGPRALSWPSVAAGSTARRGQVEQLQVERHPVVTDARVGRGLEAEIGWQQAERLVGERRRDPAAQIGAREHEREPVRRQGVGAVLQLEVEVRRGGV